MGQSCPRLRLRVSTQWFLSISSGALCGQTRGIRVSGDAFEQGNAYTSERRASVRRQLIACARRVQQCRQCRGGGGGADANELARDATANAKGTGTGACGSTICSASSCIGERVVLVCTRRCLGVFAHLGFRLRLLEHHDFPSCKVPTCRETHDAMSDSCARRNRRPGRSRDHKGVEQAADAEGHACRVRPLFASRLCTACVQPKPKGRRRDTHR